MPAKKKRKLNLSPHIQGKPGKIRQFLIDNYSDSSNTTPFNGHVLHIYMDCEKSITETRNSVIAANLVPAASNFDSAILRLVGISLKKFTTPSNKFSDICMQPFDWHVSARGHSGALNTDTSDSAVVVSDTISKDTVANKVILPDNIDVNNNTSSIKTRNSPSCVSCSSLRVCLREARTRRGRLIGRIHKLNRQLRPIRIVNQKLKRKEEKIVQLTKALDENELQKQIVNLKSELAEANRKHAKLIRYHQKEKENRNSNQQKTVLKVKNKLKESNTVVRSLKSQNSYLEDKIVSVTEDRFQIFVKDKNRYPENVRLLVFDGIVNQVPTRNIPLYLKQISSRLSVDITSIPHRSTVEAMARELGVISELQAAEAIFANSNLTIGFDATTQEGVHINSVHITTPSACYVLAIDELAGGTASDYAQHVIDTIDELANLYVGFHDSAHGPTRSRMISNIVNSITDRCAANHAAIELINSSWNTTLNELKCHLHPLDSIATKTKTALKQCEESSGSLYGKDCCAGNIVLQLNKMRFKDGKGDPRGFVVFLEQHKLPRGLIPRYRGNRLHILFHLCGIYYQHHTIFLKFLKTGTKCGGLRFSLLKDFNSVTARTELQILGLLGKLLSGPWMQKFYTAADNQVNHVDGIVLVKHVVNELESQADDPLTIISRATDFFGQQLVQSSMLTSLQNEPLDIILFKEMTTACLQAVSAVLKRQYKEYFDMQVTDELREKTLSARSHNIDAEQVMGMFSSAQQKSPSATLSYISAKIRAQKNKTMTYLDAMDECKRGELLMFAIKRARINRQKCRKQHRELREEICKRQAQKEQARDDAERKKIEKTISKLPSHTEDSISTAFPSLEPAKVSDVLCLLEGKAAGRNISHIWIEGVYNGKIEEYVPGKTKSAKPIYVVGYWLDQESYNDAVDYDINAFSLAADLILGDLQM